MRSRMAIVAAWAAALLLALPVDAGAARRGEPASPPAPSSQPPALDYEEVQVADPGTLTGFVRMPIPPPPISDLIVTRDHSVCGAKLPNETLIRAADGGLKNAVVHIEGIRKGKPLDRPRAVRIDTHLCRFEPHVAALVVGQRVEITNSDPILHGTLGRIAEEETVFNVALPVQNHKVPRTIRRPGVIKLECTADHPWATGWIVAVENPYVAVTDSRGAFRIEGIPPGTWRVVAWHETAGWQAREIAIAPGAETPALFESLAVKAPVTRPQR